MNTFPSLSLQEGRPPEQPELSTYWMPLDEPRHAWAAYAAEAALVPPLTATAHAFFALSHETKALRHFTFAWEQQQGYRFPDHAGYWYGQAEQALFEATRHWSRAACALDSLSPRELSAAELAEARQMSRVARTQQERLWKLTDEVLAAIVAYRTKRHQQEPSPAEPSSTAGATERSVR